MKHNQAEWSRLSACPPMTDPVSNDSFLSYRTSCYLLQVLEGQFPPRAARGIARPGVHLIRHLVHRGPAHSTWHSRIRTAVLLSARDILRKLCLWQHVLYETAYLPAGAIVILLPPAGLHYEELGLAGQGGAVLVVEPPYLGKIYIMGRMRMHCIFYYYHIVLYLKMSCSASMRWQSEDTILPCSLPWLRIHTTSRWGVKTLL